VAHVDSGSILTHIRNLWLRPKPGQHEGEVPPPGGVARLCDAAQRPNTGCDIVHRHRRVDDAGVFGRLQDGCCPGLKLGDQLTWGEFAPQPV
jgi:hypothetical protein